MNLNIPLLDKVATWLEAGAPEKELHGMKFNMLSIMDVPTSQFKANGKLKKNWCGTSCCIAGTALILADAISEPIFYFDGGKASYDSWAGAAELLGLDEDQTEKLFAPWQACSNSVGKWPERSKEIDAEWAARTIRVLIATGKVAWDEAWLTK